MVRCICRDTTALDFKRLRPRPSRRATWLPSHSLHFISTTYFCTVLHFVYFFAWSIYSTILLSPSPPSPQFSTFSGTEFFLHLLATSSVDIESSAGAGKRKGSRSGRREIFGSLTPEPNSTLVFGFSGKYPSSKRSRKFGMRIFATCAEA